MTQCCICHTALPKIHRQNVNISELPCNHKMHASCLVMWLQESNSCPICRTPVVPLPEPVIKIQHIRTPLPATEYIARFVMKLVSWLPLLFLAGIFLAGLHFICTEVADKGLFYMVKAVIYICFVTFVISVLIIKPFV